ncbi:MAG TPA: PIN domain-containing protein [Pelomicrobium sp.]|nr:PIN domain-containing protein [Pelomicrobium sp.]
MSAEFIDSNVFIYLFDETDPRKRGIADALVGRALESGHGQISFQVVQETLNVITRKLATPVTPHDAQRFLDRVLAPLWRVMPSLALYRRALDLQARHRHGLYDALIIAAALEAGCDRLYSEDLQHGQRIDSLTIENPFLD